MYQLFVIDWYKIELLNHTQKMSLVQEHPVVFGQNIFNQNRIYLTLPEK